MIINAVINKRKNQWQCVLKIINGMVEPEKFTNIYRIVDKKFETYDHAMAFYVTTHIKESNYSIQEIDLMNKNCNVRISPTQFNHYLKISREELPHLWI